MASLHYLEFDQSMIFKALHAPSFFVIIASAIIGEINKEVTIMGIIGWLLSSIFGLILLAVLAIIGVVCIAGAIYRAVTGKERPRYRVTFEKDDRYY